MRIISEWNSEGWKFTMLFHNNRYTLKVENGSTEQVYKLGDLTENPSESLNDQSRLPLIAKSLGEIFYQQDKLKNELLSKLIVSSDDDEFDDII